MNTECQALNASQLARDDFKRIFASEMLSEGDLDRTCTAIADYFLKYHYPCDYDWACDRMDQILGYSADWPKF